MRCAGRFSPRRLAFGFEVRAAQSRGEKPGSRTARLEVLLVEEGSLREAWTGGARLLVGGARRWGPRCEDAAEGGGARELLLRRGGLRPGTGPGPGPRNWDCCCCPVARFRGRGGGGIKEEESACDGCGDSVDDGDGVGGSGRGGIVAACLATVSVEEL